MDRSNFCGCKGVRTCLKCENKFNLPDKQLSIFDSIIERPVYVYCASCDKVYCDQDSVNHSVHVSDESDSLNSFFIPGIQVYPEFLNKEEEERIISNCDSRPWQSSQSGRRKQNFGPACNFKKHKIRIKNASLPVDMLFVQNRFRNYKLGDFVTIEQCYLEYDPNNGASIDPHIDDCWIWGERIITVNLLADTVLTLIKYNSAVGDKYNLSYSPFNKITDPKTDDIVVRIPLPRRSLIVLSDEARYMWEHFIMRRDIKERRISIAYREFANPYLPSGNNYKEVEPFYLMLKKTYDCYHERHSTDDLE